MEVGGGGLRVYKSSQKLDRAGKVAEDEVREVVYKLLTLSHIHVQGVSKKYSL